MKLYQDQFAQNHLPEKQYQPDYFYNHPDFEFDASLNCVERLLDNHIKEGRGNSIAIRTFNESCLIKIYMKNRTKLLTY
jgi:2-aminobenzoate-CoA ligase